MLGSLRDKVKALQAIEKEIKSCKICRRSKIGLLVPGEGNPNAKIMFMGEAPGLLESKVGKPFVGRSGKFLNQLLNSIGIKREDVFITSPVKFYPGRRDPTKREVVHGMKHTSKQIETINPKLIIILGNIALKVLFPYEKFSISKIHGKLIKKDNRIYFPTFHPAAAMRFPKNKASTIKDFKRLKKIIKELGL